MAETMTQVVEQRPHRYLCIKPCQLQTVSNKVLYCNATGRITEDTVLETDEPLPAELLEGSRKAGQGNREPKFVELTPEQYNSPTIGQRAVRRKLKL